MSPDNIKWRPKVVQRLGKKVRMQAVADHQILGVPQTHVRLIFGSE